MLVKILCLLFFLKRTVANSNLFVKCPKCFVFLRHLAFVVRNKARTVIPRYLRTFNLQICLLNSQDSSKRLKFWSKCAFLSANSAFAVQNSRTNLLQIPRHNWTLKNYEKRICKYEVATNLRVRFHQHFYAQILRAKNPKVQRDCQVISVFLPFWDLHS